MRQDTPDLVLPDVMMRMLLEGLDVSRELGSDPDLKQVPVVMVSSIAATEYAMDFPNDEAMPIEAWISKLIQLTVLLGVIERVLGQPSLGRDCADRRRDQPVPVRRSARPRKRRYLTALAVGGTLLFVTKSTHGDCGFVVTTTIE